MWISPTRERRRGWLWAEEAVRTRLSKALNTAGGSDAQLSVRVRWRGRAASRIFTKLLAEARRTIFRSNALLAARSPLCCLRRIDCSAARHRAKIYSSRRNVAQPLARAIATLPTRRCERMSRPVESFRHTYSRNKPWERVSKSGVTEGSVTVGAGDLTATRPIWKIRLEMRERERENSQVGLSSGSAFLWHRARFSVGLAPYPRALVLLSSPPLPIIQLRSGSSFHPLHRRPSRLSDPQRYFSRLAVFVELDSSRNKTCRPSSVSTWAMPRPRSVLRVPVVSM